MKIKVSGLKPGEIAGMIREKGGWALLVDGEQVGALPDMPEYVVLKRDHYRIIGTEPGEGRIIRYADLHRHSDSSLLDGMSKISDIVERTEYAGALTDHGNMYAHLEYYKAMLKAGKKPILGFEGYMEDTDGTLAGRHVILLAKSNQGVKNLYKLTSESFDHFKRRPHVTWEMLGRYHEGIICMTACLSGVIPHALRAQDHAAAEFAMRKFISIFGTEDFYVEIQRHSIPAEATVNPQLMQLAGQFGVKVVATTDAHYPNVDDKDPHEVLLCLQTGKVLSDPSHMKYEGTGYHLHTSEEMETLFADCPEVLDNTLEIADKCSIDLDLKQINMPKYTIPAQYSTDYDYMLALAKEGFDRKFGGTPLESDPVYSTRFQYEAEMIHKMGFASYFIIVWDFINYARSHNIYVGPGRGSAAGSLVAYCLGITDVDPIKYNLLFERFLNPERVSMPDIDTDIEHSRRDEVIQYLMRKYGAENVCRIVTFGTLAARQAVKDVGRVLGQPTGYCANLASMVPKGPKMTIKLAMETNPMLQTAYDGDEMAHTIIDIALRLEGNKRHASQHACGLVLAPSSVSDFLPTSMEINTETQEKALTSQVVMTEVEELSLIKMDLLGLKNMGVIHEVIDRVVETYGEEAVKKQFGSNRSVRYQDIPMNDRATYQMLKNGITGGVFQLESEGMTSLIQQMLFDVDTLPEDRLDECFERIVAAVALYRPGPMDYIPNYIEGMKNIPAIHYLTPELVDILKPTYGVIVFQEQVMQIVQKLAGYSMGRADVVRKAMSKKKADVLAAEEEVFVFGNKEDYEAGKDPSFAPGCVANGISESIARQIWAQMSNFAKYAFNRSHAVCYAFIAVITAYMSCHWPAEFYAAMLNAFIENSDKTKAYLHQASQRNIKLLPPDINLSDAKYRSERGNIRFGLQGISGLKSAANHIVRVRSDKGPFNSPQEFYERMGDAGERLNKKSIEGLVYGGALSGFSDNKAALLEFFSLIEDDYKSSECARELGQLTLFSDEQLTVPFPTNVPRLTQDEALRKEFETLGLYLTGHPTDRITDHLPADSRFIPLEDMVVNCQDQTVATYGIVRDFRTFITKSGSYMASFVLESRLQSVQCVIFPKTLQKVISVDIKNNDLIAVTGTYREDVTRDAMQLIVDEVNGPDAVLKSTADQTVIEVIVRNKLEQECVLNYIKSHPGDTSVRLACGGRVYPLKCKVDASPAAVLFLSGAFREDLVS